MAFGYFGKEVPQTRQRNEGVFEVNDITTLISRGLWKLQDIAGEYLVIAAGGGGGGGQHAASHYRGSGGGGGGGFIEETDAETFNFKPNIDYAVQIGSGGLGGYNGGGGAGGNTTLEIDDFAGGKTTLTSFGGGEGKEYFGRGGTGGSGGGNGSRQQTSNSIQEGTGQGNAGRMAPNGRDGGGGGGKGDGGGTGSHGGSGQANDITGASVTYSAGRFANSGGSNSNGSGGTANRGMGGSGTNRENRSGGNGGSGIIVLTIPSERSFTAGAGVTASTSDDGTTKTVSITGGSGNISFG